MQCTLKRSTQLGMVLPSTSVLDNPPWTTSVIPQASHLLLHGQQSHGKALDGQRSQGKQPQQRPAQQHGHVACTLGAGCGAYWFRDTTIGGAADGGAQMQVHNCEPCGPQSQMPVGNQEESMRTIKLASTLRGPRPCPFPPEGVKALRMKVTGLKRRPYLHCAQADRQQDFKNLRHMLAWLWRLHYPATAS